IPQYCEEAGCPEEQVREAARVIAQADSVALFEDLGVQMNRNSTLVSYLHYLIAFGTGNYGRKGSMYPVSSLQQILQAGPDKGETAPVTGTKIINGLVACNRIPDEILTDHPGRLRGAFVEAANPVHSLADSQRMREAFEALDFLVVVDVAMSETAELADYVLPVATQFEKAEATFFNFEFPKNYFHLRTALMDAPEDLFSEPELHARLAEAFGTLDPTNVDALASAWEEGREAFRTKFFELVGSDPGFMGSAPAALYRAIGDKLPAGRAEGAALWAIAQIAAQKIPDSIRRAGIDGPNLGDALFDAIIASDRGLVFAVDEWGESLGKIGRPGGRIDFAVPELFEALDGLATRARMPSDPDFPMVLSAGERRSFTANTIVRNPAWRRKGAEGALTISPLDAERLGLTDGGRARLSTRRGSAEVSVEVSDRMQAGHCSLPNGTGLSHAGADGHVGGIAPNELTASEDCDELAGTPWHKSTAARVEAL
ncbi:unnamed protein product, partial [Discosporangium mesarthrocarpum]